MNEISGKRFVEPESVETLVYEWGRHKWLSEPSVTGAKHMVVGVVTIEPGMGHLRHNHPGVEEILYFIEGEGVQMVDVNGEERRPVSAGTLVHLPADVYHETVNTGSTPLKFLVVYSPTGQEVISRTFPGTVIEPPEKK
jgi:oxalate decarboxylase/phosphoglucose isomerase-like protein (cupin superfamily)